MFMQQISLLSPLLALIIAAIVVKCEIVDLGDIILHMQQEILNTNHDESIDSYLHLEKNHVNIESFTVSTSPQCYAFSFASIAESSLDTCGNAVDYSFYVPASTTLAFLDAKARTILQNPGISILPNACQVALKKLVCSNIYLKCPDNIQIGVPATYNFAIYSDLSLNIPIPFQRPCKSLCTDANSKCLGMLALLGLTQNCIATYDYSSGQISPKPYQYDQANSPACNAMSKSFAIGSTMEPYVGGSNGACYGIVDQLYIPPSSAVSSILAPLPPPYLIQNAMESKLAASFANLPSYLSESCYFALKKFLCRSTMIRATAISFSNAFTSAGVTPYLPALAVAGINVTALLAHSISIPSYPSNDVCLDYESTCGSFIKKANNVALVANCSKTSSTPSGLIVSNYPKASQTIVSLPVKVNPTTTINVAFASSPDSLSYATASDYTTTCPEGFVVPDEPDDDRVNWISGTGCAVSCRIPINTAKEFEVINSSLTILSFLSVGSCLILLWIWLADKKRRQQVLVILFAGMAMISSIAIAAISYSSDESLRCASNAVAFDQTDGFNLCAITSFMNSYGFTSTSLAWCIQAIDVNLKVVWNMKTERYLWIYVAVAVLVPLYTAILTGVLGMWGYSGGPNLCFFNKDTVFASTDVYVIFIPNMVCNSIGLASMVWVIIEIYRISRRSAMIHPHAQAIVQESIQSNEKPKASSKHHHLSVAYTQFLPFLSAYLPKVSEDTMRKLRTPLIFSIVYIGFWMVVAVYRLTAMYNIDEYKNSLTTWAKCAFENFDGKTQDWHSICGYYPAQRIPYYLTAIYNIFQAARGIILATIYLANPNLWVSVYDSVIIYFSRLCSSWNKEPKSATASLIRVDHGRRKSSVIAVKELRRSMISPSPSTRGLDLASPGTAPASKRDLLAVA